MNPVFRERIFRRVRVHWAHTVVMMMIITTIVIMVLYLSSRFLNARLVVAGLMTLSAIGILLFLVSELVVRYISAAVSPDPVKHKVFIDVVDEILRENRWRLPPFFLRPRLYVADFGDMPNAFAFGMGFLGQYGIAVTDPLYRLMTELPELDTESTEGLWDRLGEGERIRIDRRAYADDEAFRSFLLVYHRKRLLKGVIAHEMGHIRSKDVGLSTVISLIVGGISTCAQMLKSVKKSANPAAFFLGQVIDLILRIIVPMGRSAVSLQREFTADALGALYVGSAAPLADGLSLLEKHVKQINKDKPERRRGVLDGLMISHPKTDDRIAMLEWYERAFDRRQSQQKKEVLA